MIKVVSYNVHGNAGSVIETLQRLDADIVCLNEVYEGSIEYLADELEMDYSFFGPSHSKFGNGLLSKFPIITTKNHVLNSKSEKKHSRSLIEAQIQFTLCNEEEIEHEVILDVFITHLEHISERVRLKQMEEVMDIIQQSKSENHLLIGDMNTLRKGDYSQSQWNQIIELRKEKQWIEEGKAEPLELVIPFIEDRGYRDLWIENGKKGQMFTAWTKNPLMRIDYFFASKTFSHKIVECITDASPASDHFPITLQIQLLT